MNTRQKMITEPAKTDLIAATVGATIVDVVVAGHVIGVMNVTRINDSV